MIVRTGSGQYIRFGGMFAHANALLECGLTFTRLDALKPRVRRIGAPALAVPTAPGSAATAFATLVSGADRTSGDLN